MIFLSNIDQLISQVQNAIMMKEHNIMFMREKVLDYYKSHLSPESFKLNFFDMLNQKDKEIICCDDHRSVDKFTTN